MFLNVRPLSLREGLRRILPIAGLCLLAGTKSTLAVPGYALIDDHYYAWNSPVEVDLMTPSLSANGISVTHCEREGDGAILVAEFSATLGSDVTTFYFSSIEYQPYDNALILNTPGGDLICDQGINGPAIFAHGFE